MGYRQEKAIGAAIVAIFSERNSGTLCCTIETVNAEGQDVAIQVMQDSINIAPYPFGEEPLSRLERNGVCANSATPSSSWSTGTPTSTPRSAPEPSMPARWPSWSISPSSSSWRATTPATPSRY